MQVELLSMTSNPVDVMYTAARTCYSMKDPITLNNEVIDEDKKISFLNKVIGSGHFSVTEHVNFTFAIGGVSRALLAQLTRHRIASYSVQSMRYVDFTKKLEDEARHVNPEMSEFEFAKELVEEMYTIPNKIRKDEKLYKEYVNACYYSLNAYGKLVRDGAEPEDARGVLGNNFKTNITCTFNFRSFSHLCGERMCSRSQDEIRKLVYLMAGCIDRELPWAEKYFQPKCVALEKCREAKSCGRY